MHFSQSFAAKLTAGLLAVTGMIAPAFAVSGTVDAEGGLRLRNASSTDAAVLETIPDGSQIEVSGITESGWYQVSFQDTQGYVSTDYVVLSETVELPTVAEPVYGKVTEGPLNVRSAPSTDSEKVDSFSTGKVLTILETLDGWYKVEEGYVSADYVTIIDAAEAASSGSASEVVDLAMQYLAKVDLEKFADHYPKELSGGMKQRVAIARAYAADPEVLLMDEPFGALDAQTRTQLQSELLETWERDQKTCFFITHDVDEAIILAQRVIIMSARPGRIKDIVDIDIPYPRTQETKMTPRFLELKNHIWSQVYQEYLEVRK